MARNWTTLSFTSPTTRSSSAKLAKQRQVARWLRRTVWCAGYLPLSRRRRMNRLCPSRQLWVSLGLLLWDVGGKEEMDFCQEEAEAYLPFCPNYLLQSCPTLVAGPLDSAAADTGSLCGKFTSSRTSLVICINNTLFIIINYLTTKKSRRISTWWGTYSKK